MTSQGGEFVASQARDALRVDPAQRRGQRRPDAVDVPDDVGGQPLARSLPRQVPRLVDLAREFERSPFGPHSPELQAVLNVLRGSRHCQDLLLICTKPHTERQLAEKQPHGQPPRLIAGAVFGSLEAAEWHAFRMRWEAVTGQPMPPLDRE